jgi:hypothetical protein
MLEQIDALARLAALSTRGRSILSMPPIAPQSWRHWSARVGARVFISVRTELVSA